MTKDKLIRLTAALLTWLFCICLFVFLPREHQNGTIESFVFNIPYAIFSVFISICVYKRLGR